MIVLDLKDARPLYEQIVERFKHLILCGALPEDEKMPSVRNLAMELSINPNTIQRAYMELERQGFIYSVKGRGSFVSFNEELLSLKQKEVMEKLQKAVEAAKGVQIPEEEVQKSVKRIYRGEEMK